MKTGNLKDFGWNKTVRDVDRALALARLTGTQSVLMQAARERSWHKPAMRGEEARPFVLNATEFSVVLKSDRSHVSKAKSALIQAKILIEQEDGRLLINKDYHAWTKTGAGKDNEPLFDEADLAYITRTDEEHESDNRVKNHTCTVSKTTRPDEVHRVENDTPTVSKMTHAPCEKSHTPCEKPHVHRVENDTCTVSKTTRFGLGADIGTPASERLKRDLRESHHEDPLPPRGNRDDDDGGQKPLAQRPEFQAKLRDLNRWHQDSHPGDLSITHVHISLLLAKAPDHPEWVKDAIEDSLLRAKGSKSTYAMSCLMDRLKDPEAWERERARRAGKTISGAKLLPSQTSPPPNLYIPTAEDRAIWAVQMERRRELGKLRAAERNRRMAK